MNYAYYNENDPFAAAWLRALMAAGHIMDGHVDERSIEEVKPEDLHGFVRHHFFAGIGGWDYALRLAGWPDDRPVWTGSCPCQPFSCAGKGEGVEDERHLWPEFFRLIKGCRPGIVFGEQVASAQVLGVVGGAREEADGADEIVWLDGVCADVESADYALGAVVLGAHSVNAPHIRQRTYWLADAQCRRGRLDLAERGPQGGAADRGFGAADSGLPHPKGGGQSILRGADRARDGGHVDGGGAVGGLRNPMQPGLSPVGSLETGAPAADARGYLRESPWGNYILLPFRDGKTRRLEPGLEPLVDRLPGRVGLLRGYGNAIVPQVAAEFIQAYLEIEGSAL